MDSRKRNLLILLALVGAWALILAFRSPWGSSARTDVRVAPATSPRTPAAQDGGLPRLKRELLNLPTPAYPSEVQNIFGTALSPPRPAQAGVAPPGAGGPPGAVPGPVAPPPDPFQEEAKQLRYVGYVEDGPRIMAFIIRGPEVYTVEAGAAISERFRVQTITEEAVLVSSPTGDKQARLPLAAGAAAVPK
jgi:hypothetical protein